MSLIAPSKFGDCDFCPAKNTNVVKRGKEYFCLECNRTYKTKQAISKANQRTAVRGLINKQREDGTLDSTKELILDLDRVVSRYVRLKEMGKDGKVQCFTCPRKLEWTRMQNGHFIPRANLGLRFDTTYNCRPQCPNCNVTLYGNLESFAANLEKEKPGIVEYLREQAREVSSPTRNELKHLLYDFQNKLRQVETAKCIRS